jgi:hypothetical protein
MTDCPCKGLQFRYRKDGATARFDFCSCVPCSCDDGVVYLRDGSGYEYVGWCPECRPRRRSIEYLDRVRLPWKYRKVPKKSPGELDKGLTWAGKVGSGKTTTLCTALAGIAAKGVSARYAHVPALIRQIKDQMQTERDGELLKHARSVTVLGLDDFNGGGSEWERATLAEIITRRYEGELTTYVTTNCQPPELEKRLGFDGERVVSRLHEMAPFVGAGDKDRRVR